MVDGKKKRSDARLSVIGIIAALGIQSFLDGLAFLLYPDDPTTRASIELVTGIVYIIIAAYWLRNWLREE